MNLTGGQFKGIKIEVPKSARPTLNKVRQSVFNILVQYELKNKTFLDMFSGSGLMALEAYSRGFNVLALEIDKKTVEIIKKNYKKLTPAANQNNDINPDFNILQKNALNFKTDKKFEIIYLDPPWSKDYSLIIKKAAEFLDENGIIIIESDNQRNIELEKIIKDNNLNLKIIKSKKYGRCLLDFLS